MAFILATVCYYQITSDKNNFGIIKFYLFQCVSLSLDLTEFSKKQDLEFTTQSS